MKTCFQIDNTGGFISGRSTTLQLLEVLDAWAEAIDAGHSVDVIYLDFLKAFDTVPYRRLIGKLKAYHTDDSQLEWIECFLSDRQQMVTVNGQYSERQEVTSGIPRGSVLGPNLFLVFINDLPSGLKSSEGFMFADETKL